MTAPKLRSYLPVDFRNTDIEAYRAVTAAMKPNTAGLIKCDVCGIQKSSLGCKRVPVKNSVRRKKVCAECFEKQNRPTVRAAGRLLNAR